MLTIHSSILFRIMIVRQYVIAWLSALGLLVALSACATVEQAKDRVEEEINERVEKNIDQAVETAADTTEASIENAVRCATGDEGCIEDAQRDGKTVVLTDEDGTVKRDEEGSPVTASDGEGAGSTTVAPDDANVNYDFKPGERTLFAEDFSTGRVGAFPRSLKFHKGTFEIVEWNGGRWLRAYGGGISGGLFAIPLDAPLPERFTITFDLHEKDTGTDGIALFVTDKGRHHQRNYEHNFFRIGRQNGTGVEAGGNAENLPTSLRKSTAMFEGVARIRIMVDGSYAKVYVNKTRVSNIPNADLVRNGNLLFWVSAPKENPTYIGNIRVAGGGRDLYKALESTGRVAVQDIRFDTGEATIKPSSEKTLEEIATLLREHPDLHLVVEGHTDNTGSFETNMTLSKKRASAVKSHLVNHYDIAESRLKTIGLGSTQPAASNDTQAGRAENRRVELVKRQDALTHSLLPL